MSGILGMIHAPPYERVIRRTRRAGDCLVFPGWQNQHGYGRVKVGSSGQLAHRVVWKHHHGAIPRGLCVLHHCDNPACVDINHLWLGTRTDNLRDMSGKERGVNKLTIRQVGEVRQRLAQGERQVDIAKSFGVCNATISNINTGKKWGWLNASSSS